MKSLKACIFNIQKYSIHDGPGIRTVIFFKGCPLRCLWCSNPESQDMNLQLSWDISKCKPNEKCPLMCPYKNYHKYIETNDFEWIKSCPHNALSIYGEYRDIDYIMNEIIKDVDFYEESGGRVTLSGGEVLLHHEFAKSLLKKLKEHNIHTAIETTGYANPKIFNEFITNVDLILYDLKHYDSQRHFEYTNVYNEIIIENLKTAVSIGKEVVIRIPVIPKVNNSLEDAVNFCKLIKSIGAKNVNLLPFHQFGQKKYSLLCREYKFKGVQQLHEEDLLEYKNIFIENGLNCTI